MEGIPRQIQQLGEQRYKIVSTAYYSSFFMMAFYVTLPSNSSMDVYPENTLSNYRVKLPTSLQLSGEWEVGLVEIAYPHSWYVLSPNSSKISIRSEQDSSFREIDLKGRHFRRIEGVASHLLPGYLRDLYSITYNDTTCKVTITPEPGHELLLEGQICSTLGFDDPCIITTTTEAPYPAALNAVHHLFVYTDIIESQVVGHVKAPLLKTVPVHGDFGDTNNIEYQNPHYYPLRQSVIDTIEIDIRDDTGKKVSFERGRVIVKLHFRQKRSSYL